MLQSPLRMLHLRRIAAIFGCLLSNLDVRCFYVKIVRSIMLWSPDMDIKLSGTSQYDTTDKKN